MEARREKIRLKWVSRPWILNLAILKETLKASNGKIRSWYWQQCEIIQDKLGWSSVCSQQSNKGEHHVWYVLSSCLVYKWVRILICPLSNFLSMLVLHFNLSRNQKHIGKVTWQQMTAAKSSHLLPKVSGLAGWECAVSAWQLRNQSQAENTIPLSKR